LLEAALTSFAGGLKTEAYFLSDDEVVVSLRGHQNNTDPKDEAMWKETGAYHYLQLFMLLFGKKDERFRKTGAHGFSPLSIRMNPW
jgi:hypothetical protein